MTLLARLMNSASYHSMILMEGEAGGAGGGTGDPAGGDPAGGEKKAEGGDDKSFLGGEKKDGDPAPGPAKFPDAWRDLMAPEGDAETRKLLDRYGAPSEVGKALRETQTRLRSGKAGDPPARPADDKPEELKAWRKEMGLPEEPTGYKLPETVAKRVTDGDKPNLEIFLDDAFKHDMSPSAAGAAVEIYFNMQDKVVAAMQAADASAKTKCEDTLRDEWGRDFRPNSRLAEEAAIKLTPGINWFEARLPDGRRLGDIPEAVKTWATLGRQMFGDVLFAGDANTKASADRITEIKGLMSDQKSEYYTDGGKLKAEYMALLQAQDKAQGAPTRTGVGTV